MHGVCQTGRFSQGTVADLASDVEIHHLETRKPLEFSSMRVIAQGPLRAVVETQVKYGKSTINVTVC